MSVAFKIKEPIENSDFGKLKDLCDSSIPEDVQLTIPEISRYKVQKYVAIFIYQKPLAVIRLVPEFLKYLLHTLLTVLPIFVIKVLRILFFLTNGKKEK